MQIRLFLTGVLLACLPLFRQDFFVTHSKAFPLYFILFPIGLLIMLWSVCGKRWIRFSILLGAFIVVEALLMGSAFYMIRYQRYDPIPERYYYWVRAQYSFFKGTTNFDSNLSRYDSSLTYRFLPSIKGRFTNPEFDVEIETNSLGVRDDETSLKNPSVVVLGDSHGMGWGVEKHDRFSEIIESQLQTKVLNTAITSYGTYREAKLLRQVNIDSCKLLIIQYCDNDLEENRTNLPNPQKSTTNAHSFVVAERQNIINKTYFPFKGVFVCLRDFIASGFSDTFRYVPQTKKPVPVVNSRKKFEHADSFFPYLNQIRKFYKGPILVFDLGVYNYPLVNEFQAYQNINLADGVFFVNVHPLLDRQYYFTIDDHINARGHRKIGTALSKLIQEKNWLR